MVDLEPEWLPSTKLNAIGRAVDFSDADPLPPNITRDEVEEYCYTLRQMYKTYVDELVAETELSRREAQTWALRNLVFDEGERLTYEAIGLYIWAIGRATDGDPLSRTIVSDYHERAERKIDRAEATVKRTGPPPYPDDLYDDPTLLWVDQPVGERLQRRLDPEETFSDCIERLLDETSDALSLAAFVDAYRGRGSEYVAVDTVYPTWDRTLRFVVHLPESESTPPRSPRRRPSPSTATPTSSRSPNGRPPTAAGRTSPCWPPTGMARQSRPTTVASASEPRWRPRNSVSTTSSTTSRTPAASRSPSARNRSETVRHSPSRRPPTTTQSTAASARSTASRWTTGPSPSRQ
ncbi:hypothetical protein VB779_14055 [Haloarculaceae archaeon H-GB11]|nr:hypothetical protein [Haloarculaceae archaeon H-GB11]